MKRKKLKDEIYVSKSKEIYQLRRENFPLNPSTAICFFCFLDFMSFFPYFRSFTALFSFHFASSLLNDYQNISKITFTFVERLHRKKEIKLEAVFAPTL